MKLKRKNNSKKNKKNKIIAIKNPPEPNYYTVMYTRHAIEKKIYMALLILLQTVKFRGEKTPHILHEWHKCHLLAHVFAIVLKNNIYIYQNIKLFLSQLNNY
jgi:hypothetical protein